MNGFLFPYRNVPIPVLLFLIQTMVPAWSSHSPAAEVEPQTVERLVKQLGSSEFAEREAASERLRAIGEPALDVLEQAAAEADDTEIRFRAAALVKAIEDTFLRELRRFEGHEDRIISVAFSSDGRRALSGGGEKPQPDGRWLPGTDFSVRLWDVQTGEELRRFEGHSHAVMSVALSPDVRRAVSGSMDKTVRLWELETGKELRRFQGHRGLVEGVAYSPDGRYALSSGYDGTMRLWRLSR